MSQTPSVEMEKTEDKKPDTSLAAKTEDKASSGAPEKYEPFKAPEGYELDEKFAEEAGVAFKELNLSQEQAQKLVDLYSAKVTEAAEAPYKHYEETRNAWRKDVINDRELGNGKDDLKTEVKATIGRAIDSLPQNIAKDFREAMTLTGAGDNPAFIKAIYSLAARVGEGTAVKVGGPASTGQSKPGAPTSAAAALFPNLPSSSRS